MVTCGTRSDDYITIKDLHIITSILRDAAPRWLTIGGALELEEADLTIIQRKPLLVTEGDTGYFREMLSQWLRRAPPKHTLPTITDLERAVRDSGLEDLANDFREELFLQRKGKSGQPKVQQPRVQPSTQPRVDTDDGTPEGQSGQPSVQQPRVQPSTQSRIRPDGDIPDVEKPLFPNQDKDKIFHDHDPQLQPPTELVQAFAKGVTVVIQTCNQYEYYAALERIKPPSEQFKRAVQCDNIDTEHTKVTLGKFADRKAAIVWTEQGACCMSDLQKVLGFFPNAKALLGLGVAFGMDRKVVRFCDVLVAKQIVDGAERPKIEDGELQFRGQTLNTHKTLNNIFCKDTTGWEFLCTKEGRQARAVIGPLVSSPYLIDDHNIKQSIRKKFPNAIGGEMEGWVHYTLIQSGFNNIKTIIIKGVADYADGTKEKSWQLTGAKAAVDYAHYQLERSSAFKEPQAVPLPLSLISLCVFVFAIIAVAVAAILGGALY